MYTGPYTALITPFANNAIDEKAFRNFVKWQIEQGISGLVPVGTTGESPTLTQAEKIRLYEITVEEANGKCPVIAGTGTNSTQSSIELSQIAKDVGVDAILIVAPYYNKPTQEGIYQHFKAIHDKVDIPIIIYNIPGRSVVDITLDTVYRLAELDNIVGIKDASPDLRRPTYMKNHIKKPFALLSGEDASTFAYLAQGGHGAISVTSNLLPKECAELSKLWESGNIQACQKLNEKLLPIHDILFCEPNPGPVKYALSQKGICSPDVRLPLYEISDENKNRIKNALKDF